MSYSDSEMAGLSNTDISPSAFFTRKENIKLSFTTYFLTNCQRSFEEAPKLPQEVKKEAI